MKTTKSIAQSTTVKLSQLAKNQGKPFDKLLTIFLLERAIVRMIGVAPTKPDSLVGS